MPGPVVLQTDISNKGHLFKGSVSPRENTLFCRTVSISLKHAAERERERKGAKIGYVIHQNITVDTWRHWFPRHACTVLHLLDARWRTQCPQLATHSAEVTFFSCWLLRPIRSGERHQVGRPFERGPWRIRSSGQSHAPTSKHGRVSVTNILSFACFLAC